MGYKGIAKGRIIELDEPLPYAEGWPVDVVVKPAEEQLQRGSAAVIRQAMREPPHLAREAVDELDRAIAAGKLPVQHEGVFENER
jgi:hypothetical protein